MKKIKNQYFEQHIYEGNILEIEYTSKNIDFMNSAHVDNAIKRVINETSAKTGNPIIIVLNFKNVEFVNSTAIGVVIAMWNDLKKANKKETPLYCINLNKNILRTYKMLKMDHRILLFNFDSIEHIIYFEKYKKENRS